MTFLFCLFFNHQSISADGSGDLEDDQGGGEEGDQETSVITPGKSKATDDKADASTGGKEDDKNSGEAEVGASTDRKETCSGIGWLMSCLAMLCRSV